MLLHVALWRSGPLRAVPRPSSLAGGLASQAVLRQGRFLAVAVSRAAQLSSHAEPCFGLLGCTAKQSSVDNYKAGAVLASTSDGAWPR